jgi:hypothetical protein
LGAARPANVVEARLNKRRAISGDSEAFGFNSGVSENRIAAQSRQKKINIKISRLLLSICFKHFGTVPA